MAEWRKYALKEIILFKNGKKRPSNEGNYPVYGGNGILGYADNYNMEMGIVIGRVGAYCGSVFYSPNKCWVSDNAIQAVNQECSDLLYDYYLLKSIRLNERYIGTSQPLLTQEILNRIMVKCPDLSTQKKIAAILSSIDCKIRANKAINDNLEQMAKTIYDYWFTQFDFPDESGKPYRSSGGKMVWNEQLKREIPVGWKTANIRRIANLTWGQCPDGSHILPVGTPNTMDYCSGAGDMKGGFLVACQATTDASRRIAHKDDVVLSVAGKIGDISVVDREISLGRATVAFSPKQSGRTLFIYFLLEAFKHKLDVISSGSIQKVINNDHIDEINFAYDSVAVDRFSEITKSIYRQLKYNELENRRLIGLRDWLLPMLMNGQATVSD